MHNMGIGSQNNQMTYIPMNGDVVWNMVHHLNH